MDDSTPSFSANLFLVSPLNSVYLSKHCNNRFNTTYSPTSNSKTISHSGVWVCANHTVEVQNAIFVEDNSGKILNIYLKFVLQFKSKMKIKSFCDTDTLNSLGSRALVYLVYSARTRGENPHVMESTGCPFKKSKPFFVALELQLFVSIQCITCPCYIHSHRMVNNSIHRNLHVQSKWKYVLWNRNRWGSTELLRWLNQ